MSDRREGERGGKREGGGGVRGGGGGSYEWARGSSQGVVVMVKKTGDYIWMIVKYVE